MLDKIKDLIIHPKRIGLYYKDSFLKIFLYLAALFIILSGVTIIVCYNTAYFNHTHSKDISSAVIQMDDSNILYDSNTSTLSGNSISCEFDDKIIYFLANEAQIKRSNKMIFNFKADRIELTFSSLKFASIEYKDIDIKDFSLKGVQEFNDAEIIKFEEFMDVVFQRANKGYAVFTSFDTITMNLMLYGIVVLVGLLSAWFRKPEINSTVRFKLVLYSTSVYFIVMLLSVLYSATWIQYVAMGLPIIYCNITFSRIVKVVRREE